MNKMLLGEPIAEAIYRDIRADFTEKTHQPLLAIILVGDNPASLIYIQKKISALESIGGTCQLLTLPYETPQKAIIELISSLNLDTDVNGILVQLPLPRHHDASEIISHIAVEKDVDGLHPYNLGQVTHGRAGIPAATPAAVISILSFYDIELTGKTITLVNNSILLGRPLVPMLTLRGATVTLCHKETQNISRFLQQADIIITATGKENFIQVDEISSHTIIIDVGITKTQDGKITGDCSQEAFQKSAKYTPVPGGVGPVTVACLIDNLYRRSSFSKEIKKEAS